jgi:hypothetical protein
VLGENVQAGSESSHDAPGASPRLGWRSVVAVLALYLACVAVATFPMITVLGSRLPSLSDPVEHIWTMRWYKMCLLEGRSPLRSADTHFPVGAPLGYFPPMHLQTLLFIPISDLTNNDYLSYNLIWIFGLVTTGLGSFVLAWHVLRDRAAAAFAGLVVMLGTPLLMHAHGHVELIYVGAVPLFLVGWMRFVDEPRWGRLWAATGLYWLVAMSSTYYVVLTVVPAALYVLVRAMSTGWAGLAAWIRTRLGWLLGYATVTGLGLVAIFTIQLATIAMGDPMARRESEFVHFRAPFWSYVVPTSQQALGRILHLDIYEATGFGPTIVESASYLGMATIVLLVYAAMNRVRTPGGSFWWSGLGLMVVLSLGAFLYLGARRFPLPALWLWKLFPPFRLLRVSSRFNIYAGLFAAVLAAAGLKHLLSRLPGRCARGGVFAGICTLAVADLAMIPFHPEQIPPMPAAYARIFTRHPEAALLEFPLVASASSHPLMSVCIYWQAQHRGRTSAGYTGFPNSRFDTLILHDSPFAAATMERAGYLQDPERAHFGLVANTRFLDYAWLYLAANHFDYLVLHHARAFFPGMDLHLERLEPLLRHARVFEDAATTVYDRARLEPPAQPTLVRLDGWRSTGWPDRLQFVADRHAHLALYSPDGERPMTLVVHASAFRRPRWVRLVEGDREFACWRIDPGESRSYASPPFRLPFGVHQLTLASDGDEKPSRSREAAAEGDPRPYSLRVQHLSISAVPDSQEPAQMIAEGNREQKQ